MPRPWRGTRGSPSTLTVKVNAAHYSFKILEQQGVISNHCLLLSAMYLKWCKRGSFPLLQWPSCLRMFSCSCSLWWWVSSFTYLGRFTGFPDPSCLIKENQSPQRGLCSSLPSFDNEIIIFYLQHSMSVFRLWCVFQYDAIIKYSRFQIDVYSQQTLYTVLKNVKNELKPWQNPGNFSRSSDFAVMVLFVQCITVNLFCRWRVRRKTQSPSSLFRLSYGEHSEKFHHVTGDWAAFLLLLNLNFPYSLCVFFLLRPFLSAEQNHLLHLVVQERITPSGQGI